VVYTQELVLPSNLLRSVRPTQDSRLIFVSGPSRGRSAKMGPIQVCILLLTFVVYVNHMADFGVGFVVHRAMKPSCIWTIAKLKWRH
jgi:hypothetical protein